MPELTSKPNWNLIGIIELRAEEFVQRRVEDIVELEEGIDDELQVELDNAAVVCEFGNDGIRWRNEPCEKQQLNWNALRYARCHFERKIQLKNTHLMISKRGWKAEMVMAT